MNLSSKLRLTDIGQEVKGKGVVIRVDYNVPMEKGQVMDTTRIEATLPTLQWLLERQPRHIAIISHLGRPDGRIQGKYSLQPVAAQLQKILGKSVEFISQCVGQEVESRLAQAQNGQVFLLENLRFHLAEEGKGKDQDGKVIKASADEVKSFRDGLSKLGEVYVNDAFGTSHRAHSSIVGMQCKWKVAGLLIKQELEYFGRALEAPDRPLVVLIGGAKVSDKIKLIMNIIDLADHIIIGGGMAFTFLNELMNINIGKSLYDKEGAALIKEIMNKAKAKGVQVHLPVDYVCADLAEPTPNRKSILLDNKSGITDPLMGLDIGPQTIFNFQQILIEAKTIIWNGPMGMFEEPAFGEGTASMLRTISQQTKKGTLSIVGGGDSVGFVVQQGMTGHLSHVSTGGGATLELLEGKILPGVSALDHISALQH